MGGLAAKPFAPSSGNPRRIQAIVRVLRLGGALRRLVPTVDIANMTGANPTIEGVIP